MSRFVQLFPLWVTAGAGLALVWPGLFTWLLAWELITPGLQIIMLGMGLTLQIEDFRRVARHPRPVLLGVALQYTVMPLIGFALGYVFHLPTPFAVGLVLVCCCPGGTASNVITYLAGADVALSVSMTAASTMLAAFMTPTLTALLAGSRVHVDMLGLFESTTEVVVLPVTLGLGMRHFLPRVTRVLLPVAPAAAVIAIVAIVGAILGAQKDDVVQAGLRLTGAVMTAHALAFALGYAFGGWSPFPGSARTVSIEVGMQNSGLGVVLARNNFANPLVALPSAISSIFHCLIGSAVAAVWSRWPDRSLSSRT